VNDDHPLLEDRVWLAAKVRVSLVRVKKTRHCGVFCKNYDVENHKRNGRSEERSRGVGGMYTKRTLQQT
jgi:hypothetical protein